MSWIRDKIEGRTGSGLEIYLRPYTIIMTVINNDSHGSKDR